MLLGPLGKAHGAAGTRRGPVAGHVIDHFNVQVLGGSGGGDPVPDLRIAGVEFLPGKASQRLHVLILNGLDHIVIQPFPTLRCGPSSSDGGG